MQKVTVYQLLIELYIVISNRGPGKNKLMQLLFLLILEHQSQHTTCFMVNLTSKQIQL